MLTTDTPILILPQTNHRVPRQAWLCAVFILSLSACNTDNSVFVSEVITRENCDQISEGVATVSFKDVARVRGTELLEITEVDTLSLFSVSPGEQASTGYSISLASPIARLEGDSVIVEFTLGQPTGDANTKIPTMPCTIVAVARPNDQIMQLKARTTDGEALGQINF